MNNIEQYKERFYNLMESTMGDVRPIISEQPTTAPARPTNPIPQRPGGTTTRPTPQGPTTPKMTDTSYFMNKIVVSDTKAILNKFIGKTMYLYNKNGTCQSSGGKNVVYIDGKVAKTEEYTSGVPGKLNFIELYTENRDGVEVPRITDGKTGVIITFTNAYDMVKDESGGAPLVNYNQKDEEGYQEQGFNRMDDKGNVKQVGEGGGMLQYSYDFATKKWSDSPNNKFFQPCLLNALQTALPNGLKTPERTDTDFGYVPGKEDLPKA